MECTTDNIQNCLMVLIQIILFSVVDLKQCKLYKGDAEPGVKVDTTLTVDDQDMIDIVSCFLC